jgi:phosphate starvation-inducible PhoH-like protein
LPDAPTTEGLLTVVLTPDDPRRLARLGGQFDEHLRQIERQLGIRINNRGNRFELVGSGRRDRGGPARLTVPGCRFPPPVI